MTFEDYKRQFEIFLKIDSPDKLAICEKQYQEYLKQKEDSDYFELFEETISNNNRLSNYIKNLYSIFEFNIIKKDQILFLIQPSFEAEHLLIIEKLQDEYTLTHVELEESYWSKYYHDNSISTVKSRISKGYMKKTVGDQIFALIGQSMITAKKPQSKRVVLDGKMYKLSKVVDGIRKDVFKHSPDEGSKTGRIINLLETMIKLTAVNPTLDSDKEIESLITLILNCQ